MYNSKNLESLNHINDIIFLNIEKLNADNTKYDFCLINDVLHHIGVEKVSELKNLIITLQNKAKYVLIKDHFQCGFFSNQTIRLMDFLGNYYNDVSTPKKYFDKLFEDDEDFIFDDADLKKDLKKLTEEMKILKEELKKLKENSE